MQKYSTDGHNMRNCYHDDYRVKNRKHNAELIRDFDDERHVMDLVDQDDEA